MEKASLKGDNLLSHPQTNISELTKFISLMSSTVLAVLSADLQLGYLYKQQMQSLKAFSCQAETVLSRLLKQELFWWVEN